MGPPVLGHLEEPFLALMTAATEAVVVMGLLPVPHCCVADMSDGDITAGALTMVLRASAFRLRRAVALSMIAVRVLHSLLGMVFRRRSSRSCRKFILFFLIVKAEKQAADQLPAGRKTIRGWLVYLHDERLAR